MHFILVEIEDYIAAYCGHQVFVFMYTRLLIVLFFPVRSNRLIYEYLNLRSLITFFKGTYPF
jgi:hypothetical protein